MHFLSIFVRFGIGATIHIGREIQCLQFVGFFLKDIKHVYLSQIHTKYFPTQLVCPHCLSLHFLFLFLFPLLELLHPVLFDLLPVAWDDQQQESSEGRDQDAPHNVTSSVVTDDRLSSTDEAEEGDQDQDQLDEFLSGL